jgi:hypothetical protein
MALPHIASIGFTCTDLWATTTFFVRDWAFVV